jgi:hypothetical protein
MSFFGPQAEKRKAEQIIKAKTVNFFIIF